eukprot:2567795-Pyramimonas_sp.AAC.2
MLHNWDGWFASQQRSGLGSMPKRDLVLWAWVASRASVPSSAINSALRRASGSGRCTAGRLMNCSAVFVGGVREKPRES